MRGRLWRCSDPSLSPDERGRLVSELMTARRDIGRAKASGDPDLMASARRAVDRAKCALGERGRVWWSNGTPDYNRHLAKNTPYADWFSAIGGPHA